MRCRSIDSPRSMRLSVGLYSSSTNFDNCSSNTLSRCRAAGESALGSVKTWSRLVGSGRLDAEAKRTNHGDGCGMGTSEGWRDGEGFGTGG